MNGENTFLQGLLIWAIVSGFLGTFLQTLLYSDDYYGFSLDTTIYAALLTWEKLDGVVNLAGKIICVTIVETIFLPSTIFGLVLIALYLLFMAIWRLFVSIFRVKDNKKNEK